MSAMGRPVFVLSSGRCGSTMLSDVFRLHPRILSISEFFSMLGGPRAFARPRLTGQEFWQLLSRLEPDLQTLLLTASMREVLAWDAQRAHLTGPLELTTLPHLSLDPRWVLPLIQQHLLNLGEAAAGTHIAGLFAWLVEYCGREAWVERSGGSIEYGEMIAAAWPDARFILLTRDGRDTAYSMASHPMFRVRLARILARDYALPVDACLRADIPLHRFGAYWSALMLKAHRLLRALRPEDVHVVRYEALTRTPWNVLRELARFVTHEEAPAGWLALAAACIRQVPSRWVTLPDAERTALEAACIPGMRCLR